MASMVLCPEWYSPIILGGHGKTVTLFHRFGQKGLLVLEKLRETLFEQIGFTPKLKTNAHSVDFEIPSRKGRVAPCGQE